MTARDSHYSSRPAVVSILDATRHYLCYSLLFFKRFTEKRGSDRFIGMKVIDSDQIPPYITDARPLAGFHYCVRFMLDGE